MNRNEDPFGIVPRGAWEAVVHPLALQVRLLAEYDVAYMEDRIRADLFINGTPAGIYAIARVDERYSQHGREGLAAAMQEMGPDLERLVIKELIGSDYRRVTQLEAQVSTLEDHIHRVRWWQLRRRWAARKAS